jgi:eukaryotic-like serine/threonine-protein kinase
MLFSAGSKLGPYEILAPIGAGRNGEVYRAKDPQLDRAVAIRLLPIDLAQDADRFNRFQSEARSVSALNHPNIITIYEVGSVDSMHFISMELVDGKSLREILANGALSVTKLIQFAAQSSEALSKAHAAGILHLNLKPENIMITKDGVVKILDFGLAKARITKPDSNAASETKTAALTVSETT